MSAPPRIETMGPRELGAALMRGNAREHKQGYSWSNAHEAVLRLRGMESSSPASGELQMYLLGFAHGMVDRGYEYASDGHYREGHYDGRREPRDLILPALARPA